MQEGVLNKWDQSGGKEKRIKQLFDAMSHSFLLQVSTI